MALNQPFSAPNTNPVPQNQSTPAPQYRNAADILRIEAQDLRDKQAYRYKFMFPQSVAVPNNGQRAFQFVIDADADFYAERFTGSALGPSDSAGVRLAGQQPASDNPNVPPEPTNFPLVGTTTGYADRGLMVNIKDGGSRIELTDGFVPLELLFTPGYDFGTFHIPFPFKYYVRRTSKLVFTFVNRDKAAPVAVTGYNTPQFLYHFVSGNLDGFKYLIKTTPE
jgi:hypothetical protein